MFEVIRKTILALGVVLCIAGLSLHFTVEYLGGMQETFDSHEEDQFVLSEPGGDHSTQKLISLPFMYRLRAVSRPLPPPRQPPKPI